MAEIFSVTNISKNYHVGNQDVAVLKNISFDINDKEFLIIFGPSGCGKSTLLHVLLGLEVPTMGRVVVTGLEIYKKLGEDERALFRKENYGMIFQQSNWIKSLTVRENVAFPLILAGTNKIDSLKKADKLLSDISMFGWSNYFPDELSSGQQQKVAVARAISTNPKKDNGKSISKTDLIDLSLRNMSVKRTRTLITMGGMALGIGLIVFLVSIGYGLEQIVVSRVARLEELKQTEVAPGLSEDLALTDKSLSMFKQIPNVKEVYPVISAVGQVSINNSFTDLAVYGVTTKYLSESAIKPSSGNLFQSDDFVTDVNSPVPQGTNSNAPVAEAKILESSTGSLPLVQIASLSGQKAARQIDTVIVGGTKDKQVVINRSAAKVLSLAEDKAIGQKINLTFVIINGIGNEDQKKIQSTQTEYTIVGVIHDETSPFVYVPFIDLRSLGADSYSQIKVVADNQSNLSRIRLSIESAGYTTSSVVDTVGQIDTLFKGVRSMLAILGIVALSVAALGMFNTLTVSLLERTHEVGLMKAIGMRSSEVKDLFITESMLMGFFGGILGLILGFIVGKIASVVLSIFSVSRGVGFIDLTHIPLSFALMIFGISLLVGLFTGYIPAKRSEKISALDALRYE